MTGITNHQRQDCLKSSAKTQFAWKNECPQVGQIEEEDEEDRGLLEDAIWTAWVTFTYFVIGAGSVSVAVISVRFQHKMCWVYTVLSLTKMGHILSTRLYSPSLQKQTEDMGSYTKRICSRAWFQVSTKDSAMLPCSYQQ